VSKKYWAVTGADHKHGGPFITGNTNIRIATEKLATPEEAITDCWGTPRGMSQHGIFVKDLGAAVARLRSDKTRIALLTTADGYKTLCQWREMKPCLFCTKAIEGDKEIDQ
jgi:hypothetical protein